MNRFTLAMLTAFAVAMSFPPKAHAEREYGEKVLGTECPTLAQAVVDEKLAKSFHGYKVPSHTRQPEPSFTSDTFTFCKVTLKHEGPTMMFTKADIPTEHKWQADEILRSDGIGRVIKARCTALGGALSQSKFYSPLLIDRPTYLCKKEAGVVFMATHYTYSVGILDNANRYVLVVAEPKSFGAPLATDFAELLAKYGFTGG